jgi:hypothetical protein
MSADNTVAILHTKDGYRVKHAQAIENIYYQCRRKGDPQFNARQLWNYFSNCKIFTTQEEAWKEAQRIYDEIMQDDCCPIVEYGIQFFGDGKFEFPKECPPCCDNPMPISIDGQEQCQNCGEYYWDEEN